MKNGKQMKIMWAMLLAALLILSSCGDCPKPRGITSTQLSVTTTPSQPVSTSNQLVVYLDTSASMAGYVPDDRGAETVYSRTLQELRNFVTLINPPLDVSVRRVDTRVGEPLNDMTLSRASIDQKLFNGGDTDLAGAFDLFSQATNPEGQPARFHVLVTDGVQSTNQARPNLSCASGSDQLCVRRKIFDLLNGGWGGCVISLRSQFHGNIYSEINRARGIPSALRYDSVDDQPQTLRPFYLYVFSPERAAIEQFAATLIDRLKPLVGAEGDSLHVLPLTFRYAGGQTVAEAVVPKDSAKLLAVRKEDTKEFPEFTIGVDPSTAQAGAQPFSLAVTVPWSPNVPLSGSARELADLIRWELVPVYPEKIKDRSRYPEVKIVGKQVGDDGRIVLTAAAQWPQGVGDLCWRGYRLEGRLNPEALSPQWVSAWSTDLDTTRDAGNSTLYLQSGLLGLWRNSVLNNQLVAEASLVVGER